MTKTAKKQERKTYCRVCGPNKGHNFPACPNLAAIRRIVIDQDEEFRAASERHRAAADELGQLTKDLIEVKTAYNFLMRCVEALLDGAEAQRQLKAVKP